MPQISRKQNFCNRISKKWIEFVIRVKNLVLPFIGFYQTISQMYITQIPQHFGVLLPWGVIIVIFHYKNVVGVLAIARFSYPYLQKYFNQKVVALKALQLNQFFFHQESEMDKRLIEEEKILESVREHTALMGAAELAKGIQYLDPLKTSWTTPRAIVQMGDERHQV